MANAKFDILGATDLDLIAGLYNQIFKPGRDLQFFHRRFQSRHNPLIMAASLDDRPAGFFLGFELKPSVYFVWLFGVLNDYRRAGVASQMLEAAQAWAKERNYTSIRFECHNQHRPPLHMAIGHGDDIVGIRWDADRGENLVIFERLLD